MSLRSRLLMTVAVLGLIGATAGGVVVGIVLGDRESEPGTRTLTLLDPAFQQLLAEPAFRSEGGFTGFGGLPALNGRVLRFGTVRALQLDPPSESGAIGGTLTVETDGAIAEVRFIRLERFFAITPASTALEPGDVVQVRIEGDRAVSALLLPPDLEEGAGLEP